MSVLNFVTCFCLKNVLSFYNSGLKKLLSEHPYLFTIDNDMVDVSTFEPTCDYIQEAKEYFKQKLQLYGIGNEVPIVCLQGHRSQASFRIRHISGKCLFI